VSRWRGGDVRPQAMGFECFWDRESLGSRMYLSGERREFRSEARGRPWSEAFVGRLEGSFSAMGHRCSAHAEARGACARWNVLLRAIKDAGRAGLLPQDLLGG